MKIGLYIVNFGYKITDDEKNRNGVIKKIFSQIKAFNEAGFSVKIYNVFDQKLHYVKNFFYSFFNKNQYLNDNYDMFKNIDFVYIRHFYYIDRRLLTLISYLRHNGCYIIYEIPTYPYEGEFRGLKSIVALFIDRIFRRFLKKYVSYIVTCSDHDYIFGIPTIKITNGVDCSAIPVIKSYNTSYDLNLIAVAQFDRWHGYDRLIKGLYDYYQRNTGRTVYLHMVGDGVTLKTYKQMVSEYRLEKYVIFYGMQAGDSLSNIFNKSDIAISSLGCHRIGVFNGSFLKSREYLARGLPMISSTKIDILPSGYPYVNYVPENETSIDIEEILQFYDNLQILESEQERIEHIRLFAEQNCDISITMKPVLEILRKL